MKAKKTQEITEKRVINKRTTDQI